jgi:hypothetical protein
MWQKGSTVSPAWVRSIFQGETMRKLLLLSLVALSLPSLGWAKVLEHTVNLGWILEAYGDDASGKFSHCAATSPQGPSTLLLRLDASQKWRAGFSNDRLTLAGQTSPVTLKIDGYPPVDVNAVVTGAHQLSLDLDPESQLFHRFRKGLELSVTVKAETLKFNLGGTVKTVSDLRACVERYSKPGAAPEAKG